MLALFGKQVHKRLNHSVEVDPEAVTRKLNPVPEPSSQVFNEYSGVPGITGAHYGRRNKFRIGINGRPRPYVAVTELAFLVGRRVLFLCVDKCPDFIALNLLARQVSESAVLVY